MDECKPLMGGGSFRSAAPSMSSGRSMGGGSSYGGGYGGGGAPMLSSRSMIMPMGMGYGMGYGGMGYGGGYGMMGGGGGIVSLAFMALLAGAYTRSHFRSDELSFPLSAQLELTLSPIQPIIARGCVPKVLKLSSNVSDVSRRSSS